MRSSSLPYVALGLIIFLGALHFTAETFYLYWTIWWFDNLVHFLAGFAGGFVVIWFLVRHREFYPNSSLSKVEVILAVVSSVLIFGGVWEIFEYATKITELLESALSDTIFDLLADSLGALLAGFLGLRSFFSGRSV